MNKREMIKILTQGGIEPNEAKAEVSLILEFILNKTKESLIFEDEFDENIFLPVLKERIKTGRPIQYILNFAPFMGEKFYVNENVLIPRDDTEILVNEGCKLLNNNFEILDIGTGSGIISCIFGKFAKENNLNINVTGADISPLALEVANKNKERLNLTNVNFIISDLFSNINKQFDIIVSNPPYIPEKLKNTIQKEVRFEPDIALYTKDDKGIYFYEKITEQAKNYLKKGGFLLFEVMAGQSEEVVRLLKKENFNNIEIIPDISGIERVIKGKY